MDEKLRISLEAARVNAHLSQKDAARKLGINPATLRSYETGKTAPTMAKMQDIEKLYGWPMDHIFLPSNSA